MNTLSQLTIITTKLEKTIENNESNYEILHSQNKKANKCPI